MRHQVFTTNGIEPGFVADRFMGIGMIAIKRAHEGPLDNRAGVLTLLLQRHPQARALARKARLGKGRRGDETREQIHGRFKQRRVRQTAQADRGHLAIHARGKLRAPAFEAAGDVVHGQPVRAFVQHRAGQIRQTGLVRRIALRGGVEHRAQLHHRQLARRHEINTRAIGEGPVFDLGAGGSDA